MQPRAADNREANWAWAIWCLAPAGALMLCGGRVPLWLTMPAAPDHNALTWVLSAQAIALFALGPVFDRFRDAAMAAATALTFQTLAWSASEQSWRSYLGAAGVVVAILFSSTATTRLVGRFILLIKAMLIAAAICLALR